MAVYSDEVRESAIEALMSVAVERQLGGACIMIADWCHGGAWTLAICARDRVSGDRGDMTPHDFAAAASLLYAGWQP